MQLCQQSLPWPLQASAFRHGYPVRRYSLQLQFLLFKREFLHLELPILRDLHMLQLQFCIFSWNSGGISGGFGGIGCQSCQLR